MLTLKESKIYKLLKYMFFVCLYYLLKSINLKNRWFYLSKWIKDSKNDKLLIDYPLNSRSLVVDIGGYTGYFSDKIVSRFKPNLVIYEPVKSFFTFLKNKYKDNKKIKVLKCGLSSKDQTIKIYLSKDGTSLFKRSEKFENIKLIDVSKIFKDFKTVDLMSINIEGAEYEVLERLIETNMVKKINNLQIQFHDFVPESDQRRKKIIKNILMTHKINYSYPFVWESFVIKK